MYHGKMWYGIGLAISVIAAIWWVADGQRNPCWYVLMTAFIGMMAWLMGMLFWSFLTVGCRYMVGQILCLLNCAHRRPEIHEPEWDNKTIKVRRWGPVKDHWWSAKQYYVSIEYYVCRHAECRAFKIIRVIKDA